MSNGEATYYDIVPNSSFYTANTQFMPSRKYTVSAAVYNSTLDDATTFASHCETAKPRYVTP